MNKEDFIDAIVGLQNYDAGFVDAGIYNPVLKREVGEWMQENTSQADQWLKEHAVELLTDEEYNYTLADIRNLIEWLADEMDYYA